MASDWKEGWSEEFGQRYYFNEALGRTQWHPPETNILHAAATSSTEDATILSTDATTEALIASALGFVDPIVHAVAVTILADECDHATAVRRLRRHLSDVDSAACASAILQHASVPDGDTDSSDSSDAKAPAAESAESTAVPWERPDCGGSSGALESTDEDLHALSVGELKRRMAAAGLDHSCCVEKAELVAALTQGGGGAGLSRTAEGSGLSVLHDEIVAFAEWVRPQTAELRTRSAIKRLITRVLQPLGAGTRLEPYGSSTYTGGAGGRERLGLFCSDLDLAMSPPHPLKQVATLLSDARDVGGGRAFIDVDVLHARVPIICVRHVRSGVEIDLSGDHGGGDGGDVQALMRGAMARHAQLAPLAAVLKSLLMQRGLHEPYTGGLGSTKLYVLLSAWLDGPPRRSDDLGHCLRGFLQEHARRLPVFATAGDVEADLSAVRIPDCQRAFGEVAAALRTHGLRAILDVHSLVRARQRSLRKAEAYTAALLAAATGAGAVRAGPGGTKAAVRDMEYAGGGDAKRRRARE